MRDLEKIREKIVIQLDNRQVALAILGFILVSTGTFASGVLVGQRMVDSIPERWTAGEIESDGGPASVRVGRARTAALAAISPGTRALNNDLAANPEQPAPADPTEAARIEAHQQLAMAKTLGAARSLGPVPVAPAGAPAAEAAPVTLVERDPKREQAALEAGAVQTPPQYSLQVSAFRSESPARVVANQLRTAGHEASVRHVEADTGALWRVEVGRFESTRSASAFQREFERSAGYSTVMVAVR